MAEYVCKNGILRPINHIYQCIEELVEGVDYEKYDWLVSNNKSYINTQIPLHVGTDISLSAKFTTTGNNGNEPHILGTMPILWDSSNSCIIRIYKPVSYNQIVVQCIGKKVTITHDANNVYNNTRSISLNQKYLFGIKINTERSVDSYNNTTSVQSKNLDTISDLDFSKKHPITLFCAQSNTWSFKTIMIGETTIDNHIFSPCQLLQPIPAKLDSQGIDRAAGECGMIDSVSGKFFGNANTTGSFSVYND